MCLFKYKEKRYGKFVFILFALACLVVASASIFGGVYAVMHMTHWSKYVIVSVAGLFGLFVGAMGVVCVWLSFSMINKSKSVRDGNRMKGIADTRLCDNCGRVISKVAEFCEHCGSKLETGLGMKQCPECKTKNSATADFCEKCGHQFEIR